MEVANAVAVDDRGSEALGDLERLGAVRACESDHFEGCAFAQLHDAGGLTRGGCGLCHVFILSNLEAAPARAGLPFGAVAPNRRKTGASRSEDDRQSGAGLRASRAFCPREAPRACPVNGGGFRPPRGAERGLEANGRWFRPQQNRRANRDGSGPTRC
ncbi:hypothetical protein D9M68_851370 [compost metagenome]